MENGRTSQLVWGVGSAPDPSGRWNSELVLVECAALGPDSGITVGRYTAFDLLRRVDPRAQRRFADAPALQLLIDWRIGPTTLIDVTTRPLPTAAQVQLRDLVRENAVPNRTATVGLSCTLAATKSPAILTAGHLVTGVGDRVQLYASGQQTPVWVDGVVVHWSDPAVTGTAGYDYAVVELLDQRNQILSVFHTGPAGPPRPPYAPIDVAAYGATSGTRTGQISGALTQLGDATRQWCECWQIGPSYLLAPGDSGGLVLGTSGAHSGKVLGHFVGGSYWPNQPGLVHQYVQDMASCLNSGLGRYISL
ncbi:hypothetical protein F5X71_16615 [Nocardia brasiliensis]|uniref:Serine protease n=1 Tax=Nocardia brasiliensis TaxID=37326 RepID=A0A6G9XS50_NOCBR|nr:hypothetical protein [Nocardia brasiliensis]QIS03726.1 hypothetical protein F5X71_16615 [Nocardia brasiliensis]